jgi:hypothetical protein
MRACDEGDRHEKDLHNLSRAGVRSRWVRCLSECCPLGHTERRDHVGSAGVTELKTRRLSLSRNRGPRLVALLF